LGILDWIKKRRKRSDEPASSPKVSESSKEIAENTLEASGTVQTEVEEREKEPLTSQEIVDKDFEETGDLHGEKTITETVEKEEVPTGRERTLSERVKGALVGYVRDHKNWSDRLVDEKLFGSRSEAKAYASLMRARGYYAKTVKVKDGYKVYVYTKKGSASVILTGKWRGMDKLQKMDMKSFKLGKGKSGSFKIDMSKVNVPSTRIDIPPAKLDLNLDLSPDFISDLKGLDLGEFDMDFNLDLGLSGLGGEKRGKKKRR